MVDGDGQVQAQRPCKQTSSIDDIDVMVLLITVPGERSVARKDRAGQGSSACCKDAGRRLHSSPSRAQLRLVQISF